MSLFSCTKEGPAGKDGADGTANVQSYFFSYTWQSSDFPFSTKDLINTIPSLTQNIIDNGAVIGYVSTNDGTSWSALPSFMSLGVNSQINFRGNISPGKYTVTIARNDGNSVSQSLLSSTIRFKIVVMSK
jgi:hypothetical protein